MTVTQPAGRACGFSDSVFQTIFSGETVMQPTFRTILYGLLALAGAAVTWYFNIRFMIEAGGAFSLATFIKDGFSNPAAASLASDVSLGAVVFLLWLPFEARRLGMKLWWVYAVLTLGVAFACAFPLFLLMRERRLEQIKAGSA
jgi:hypothetical protein